MGVHVHTSDAGPQGMRRWSGELDGPLCRCGVMGRMIEVGYTREMGLACPHVAFSLSLLISWINYAGFREGFRVVT